MKVRVTTSRSATLIETWLVEIPDDTPESDVKARVQDVLSDVLEDSEDASLLESECETDDFPEVIRIQNQPTLTRRAG